MSDLSFAEETVSTFVVYGLEFQAALHAALVAAGSAKPFDVVQFSVQPGGYLAVCARDKQRDIIAKIDVGIRSANVASEYDEVFEVSKADARTLVGFVVKAGDDPDDPPLVGLRLTSTMLERTDVSGPQAVDNRKGVVRRASYPGEDLALGDVCEMIGAAKRAEVTFTDVSEMVLSPAQHLAVGRIGQKLKCDAVAECDLGPAGDYLARKLYTTEMATIFVATEDRSVDLDDDEEPEVETDNSDETVTVVDADPTKGMA